MRKKAIMKTLNNGGKYVLFLLALSAVLFASAGGARAAVVNYEGEVGNGTFWNGRVWYPAKTIGGYEDWTSRKYTLMSYAPGSTQKPTPETRATFIPSSQVWLLAAGGRLWVVSDWFVGYYDNHRIVPIQLKNRLETITRPFVYGGRPATFEMYGGDFILQVLTDGGWVEKGRFRIEDPVRSQGSQIYLQGVAIGNDLHIFVRSGDALYHRTGLPAPDVTRLDTWQKTNVPLDGWTGWKSADFGGNPVVFTVARVRPYYRVKGYRMAGGGFAEFYSYKSRLMYREFGVYPVCARGDFVLVSGNSSWLAAISNIGGKNAYRFFGKNYNSFDALKAYAGLLMALIVVLALLAVIVRKIAPYAYQKFGIPFYRLSGVFPESESDLDSIFSEDLPENESINFTRFPTRNAVYIAPKSKHLLGFDMTFMPFMLIFKKESGRVRADIVSKVPVTFILAIIFLCAGTLFYVMMHSGATFSNTAMAIAAAVLFFVVFGAIQHLRYLRMNTATLAGKMMGVQKPEDSKPAAYEL